MFNIKFSSHFSREVASNLPSRLEPLSASEKVGVASIIHFIETPEFNRAGPTIGAESGVAPLKQKLKKVGTVLPGDVRYDCTVFVVKHGEVSSFASQLKRASAICVLCCGYVTLSIARRAVLNNIRKSLASRRPSRRCSGAGVGAHLVEGRS